jgi:hypothetical protein
MASDGSRTEYGDAEKRLMRASVDLRIAQRELEEAEQKFNAALDHLERLEQQSLPDFREMRGILKTPDSPISSEEKKND